jgi:hypothetical protein
MMARSDEAERYRRAAHAALDQLDWCIEYLRRLRKTTISKQLAKNRSAIAARLPPREHDRPSPPTR